MDQGIVHRLRDRVTRAWSWCRTRELRWNSCRETGRIWLFDQDRCLLRIEGSRWSGGPSFGISVDSDDRDLTVSATAGPGLYLGIGLPTPWLDAMRHALMRGLPGVSKYESMDALRVCLHRGTLMWSIAYPDMHWSREWPKWRSGTLDIPRLLLGDIVYTEKADDPVEVDIPLPEGPYRWQVTMKTVRRRRERWPRARPSFEYEAKPLQGEQIPIPGKDENSWGCGPDAYYGQSGCANSPDQAAAQIAIDAMKVRRRRCGSPRYVEGGRYDIARPQPAAADPRIED